MYDSLKNVTLTLALSEMQPESGTKIAKVEAERLMNLLGCLVHLFASAWMSSRVSILVRRRSPEISHHPHRCWPSASDVRASTRRHCGPPQQCHLPPPMFDTAAASASRSSGPSRRMDRRWTNENDVRTSAARRHLPHHRLAPSQSPPPLPPIEPPGASASPPLCRLTVRERNGGRWGNEVVAMGVGDAKWDGIGAVARVRWAVRCVRDRWWGGIWFFGRVGPPFLSIIVENFIRRRPLSHRLIFSSTSHISSPLYFTHSFCISHLSTPLFPGSAGLTARRAPAGAHTASRRHGPRQPREARWGMMTWGGGAGGLGLPIAR
jgi:hypothetical protein